MRITEEEQRERKERVIHAAFTLFSKKGIDGVTMSEIAQLAGVSDISVYRYFETKLDLAMETVALLWREVVAGMTRHIDATYSEKSGFEQLQILLDGFAYLFEEKSGYVRFSYDYKLYLIRHGATLLEDEGPGMLAPLYGRYCAALRKGLEDGSIRPLGTVEDMYWAVWGLMRGYVAKIALYEKLYAGENGWRKRFQLVRTMLETALRPLPGAGGA